MTDSRIPMDDLHTPLAERKAEQKGVSVTTVAGVFAVVLLAGLVIIGISQHKLLDRNNMPSDPLEHAIALMQQNPLIDGHNDLAWQFRLYKGDQVLTATAYDLTQNLTDQGLQTDIPKIQAGYLGAQFWSVFVRCNMSDAVRSTMEQIDVVKKIVARYPDNFQLAYSSSDISSAFSSNKLASLIGIEGGHSIDSSFGALRSFYELGVRYMTLTHNCNTPWAESCCDSKPAFPVTGLTAYGRSIVREMNRIGMIVDLSHVSAQTMRDALNETSAPVIFSHSAVFSLVNVTRNVPDDVLKLLATNGGIVMVTFYNDFTWTGPGPNNVTNVFKHIDYIKNLLGSVDNIGIGSDFEGDDAWSSTEFPDGLKDVSQFPNLIAELIRNGYSDDEVIQILGGNLQRVLTAVENQAQNLQSNDALQNENRLIYPAPCRSTI